MKFNIHSRDELKRVNTKCEIPPLLPITSMDGRAPHEQMRHISLNAEVAQVLADWLWEHYDAQGGPTK